MSYVRGSCGRKTPYEKKFSRKGKEQEEWAMQKSALDSRAQQVSDIDAILEQFEARSREGRKCALRNLIRTARKLHFKDCEEVDAKEEKATERAGSDEDEEAGGDDGDERDERSSSSKKTKRSRVMQNIDQQAQLEENQKMLIEYLVQGIRGSPEEALLAFDAIEILAVIYNTDEDFLTGLLGPVRSIALTTAPQTLEIEQQEVIGAAFRTLGVLCFFCCDNDDTTTSVIRDIDGAVSVEPKNASQPVIAGAISAWELLHTTTDYSDEYHGRMIAAIWKHLKSNKSSVDTRIAAGRAIALSFHLNTKPDDTIEALRKWISDIERLKDIINECAYGTTHPKTERVKEQPIFKVLAEWMIDGGDPPSETITINGIKVVFKKWTILARLETVHRITGSGFLHHIINNPVISWVLQFKVPSRDDKRLSDTDKKYARHCAKIADKQRTVNLAKQRSSSSFD